MSYSINITGHSPNPHNDDVKAIAYEAVKKLKALEGTVSLTGYVYDSSGVNFPLNDQFVADEELREAAANAPEPEPEPEQAPVEPSQETPPETTPAPTPSAPDSPESASTTPPAGA